MESYIVYKHTNKLNNKVYIGITKQKLYDRFKNGKGYGGCKIFNNAIKKYGWENFTHEILFQGLTLDRACELEIENIAKHKSNNKEYGYNISCGGSVPSAGTKRSPKHIEAIIKANTGRPMSEKTKQKIIEGRNKYWKDHPHLRKTTIKRIKKDNRIPVDQYEKGIFKKFFSSINAAAKETGISKSHISECVAGKRHTAGGYVWTIHGIKPKEFVDKRTTSKHKRGRKPIDAGIV